MSMISPPDRTKAPEQAITNMRAETVTDRVALADIELVAFVAEDVILAPAPPRLLAVVLEAEAVNPPKLPDLGAVIVAAHSAPII